MTNTLCPKIGAAQWTCTKDECTCHLKDSIGVRHGEAMTGAHSHEDGALEPYCPFCRKRHVGGDTCLGHYP